MTVTIRANGGTQMRNLSRAMKQAGRGDLRRDMLRTIRGAARPLTGEAQRAALRIPSKSGGATGARAEVAAAVTLQVRQTGVRIAVLQKKMGARAALARGWENPRGWRHPVHGNRDVWVAQDGHPWLYPTLHRGRPKVAAAVQQVLTDTARELERSAR